MKRLRSSKSRNWLLARLPDSTRRHIVEQCDAIELRVGDTLSTVGQPLRHVYFPTSGFASLVAALDAGAQVDVGVVGSEGMVGIPLVLGAPLALQTATVRCSGTAWKMPAAEFRRELLQSDVLRERLNLYVYVCMAQLSQTAACTRYHTVEARLARWLLLARDRLHSDSFTLTHELLAYMLGVRRAGVTGAANSLRERGLIRYARGSIDLVDCSGLEEAACECYGRANESYRQVLGR
jgi:CRP-like cAMP-binding protein